MYAIFWKISIKCTHYVRREGGKTRDPGLKISTPTVDWNLHHLSLRMWAYFTVWAKNLKSLKICASFFSHLLSYGVFALLFWKLAGCLQKHGRKMLVPTYEYVSN